MADEVIQPEITLDYKDLMKALESFNKEMPGVARKLVQAVNNEAKKKIRMAYKRKGYSAHVQKTYKSGEADAGYSKNLKSFANKDFSAKIIMGKDAFHYKFLEFGTHHNELTYTRNGEKVHVKAFNVPAHPILYPIANSIWKTGKSTQIMEKRFQKELDKRFKEK